MLNSESMNERTHTDLLRKSGSIEMEKHVPSYAEFTAEFSFEPNDEVQHHFSRPMPTGLPAPPCRRTTVRKSIIGTELNVMIPANWEVRFSGRPASP